MQIRKLFGEWLREEMTRRSVTQKDFAALCKVSTVTVSAYLNHRQVPTDHTLMCICEELSASFEVIKRYSRFSRSDMKARRAKVEILTGQNLAAH